jgi:hypothetical protein
VALVLLNIVARHFRHYHQVYEVYAMSEVRGERSSDITLCVALSRSFAQHVLDNAPESDQSVLRDGLAALDDELQWFEVRGS